MTVVNHDGEDKPGGRLSSAAGGNGNVLTTLSEMLKKNGCRTVPANSAKEFYYYLLKGFQSCGPYEAAYHALGNDIVVAATIDQKDAKLAILYPGPMEYSKKWKKYVPLVVEGGVRVSPVCHVFAKEPKYFIVSICG